MPLRFLVFERFNQLLGREQPSRNKHLAEL
jgi:hypothetical protein